MSAKHFGFRLTSFDSDPSAGTFERAVCSGFDVETADAIFFTPSSEPTAIAFCDTCPCKAECLRLALNAEGLAPLNRRFGVSGGLTPSQRFDLSQSLNGEHSKVSNTSPSKAGDA